MWKNKTIKVLLTVGALTLMVPLAANAQSTISSSVSEIGSGYDSGVILSEEEANVVKENAVPITKIHTFSSDLTADEISAKITEIADKYKIGELFSEEDANFIRLHATPANQNSSIQNSPNAAIAAAQTVYFEGKFNGVELTGYGSDDIGIINNSVSGNFIIRDTNQKYHKTIGSVVEYRAFGAFGEGGTGVGLVYSKDYTNSASNANYNKNVFADTYVASVAWSNYSLRGLVDGYSFTTDTPYN